MADTELGGYEILGRLAVGGMAEVLKARPLAGTQRSEGEPDEVVLKRLLPSLRADGAHVKQFVDEAKLTVRLRHPNVVRTFKCLKAGDDYLMVQELVEGRTLAYLLALFMKQGEPMPPAAAVFIVHSLLQGLDYIHRARVGEGGANIVHRDVSAANILISVTGEVKLTDFGVAEVEGLMGGEPGALRGTVPYMSPEQVLGQPLDGRSDLYSAGILLWELLANQRLHPGENEFELMHRVRSGRVPLLTDVAPALPHYAVRVVRQALFADRNLRFQTAAELMKALEVLAARSGWPLSVAALQPLLGEGEA
ncbi:MAG: serine/threonine protein kinase [Myxococcaceae bacterium]